MTTPIDVLKLTAWLSPAFPTGSFAYSHGLEWAVQVGDVTDADSLHAWVSDVIDHGAGRSDAILLRHAHAGQDVTELALAAQPSRERLAEAVAQGNAFQRAARPWGDVETPDITHAVAFGALAGRHRIDVEAAVAAWLQTFAAALISAAVRLVPLGQTDGLRVLQALGPTILAVAETTRGAGLDDVGGACFRSDIAAMRHETQYTRLFRS